MPCKASSNSTWLELRSTLEAFEEKSKMKRVQASFILNWPDSLSLVN